jgi:hypothetical protein
LGIFSICFFHFFPIQDVRAEDAGLKFGGFQWGGAIELGYRLTDIDGSRGRYKETVNLMDGLRLFDFSLFGKNLNSGTIVVILPDRGDRYLSTTLFRSFCAKCPP